MVVYWAPDSPGALHASYISNACIGAMWRPLRAAFATSTTVCVYMQKNVALSQDPMGKEICKPTDCGSSGHFMGVRKAIAGVSSRRNHGGM